MPGGVLLSRVSTLCTVLRHELHGARDLLDAEVELLRGCQGQDLQLSHSNDNNVYVLSPRVRSTKKKRRFID